MIYLLFVLTCLLTVGAYYAADRELLAPGVIFAGGFAFSELWALGFVRQWKLYLHWNTFIVLFGGISAFILATLLVHWLFKRKRQSNLSFGSSSSYTYSGSSFGLGAGNEIVLNRWLLIGLVVLEIFTMLITVYEMRAMVGGNNILKIIADYRQRSTFTAANSKLPSYIYFFRTFVMAGNYWFAYVIANNFLATKKLQLGPIIIFVIGLLNSMLFGSRGGAINMMIAFIACLGILYAKHSGHKLKFSWKLFLILTLAGTVVLLSFRSIGNLMGRNSHVIPLHEYLAEYLGAQIKNLDTFLNEPFPKNYLWGQQTFADVIKWLGPKFGLDTNYQLYLPMRFVGRYHLGNVCTTFAAFYQDFGYVGCFILSALMGLISQAVFELATASRLSNRVDYAAVVYGYIYPALVFSFFSNRFYSQMVSPLFLKCVFFWLAYNIIFCDWDLFTDWLREHLPRKKES